MMKIYFIFFILANCALRVFCEDTLTYSDGGIAASNASAVNKSEIISGGSSANSNSSSSQVTNETISGGSSAKSNSSSSQATNETISGGSSANSNSSSSQATNETISGGSSANSNSSSSQATNETISGSSSANSNSSSSQSTNETSSSGSSANSNSSSSQATNETISGGSSANSNSSSSRVTNETCSGGSSANSSSCSSSSSQATNETTKPSENKTNTQCSDDVLPLLLKGNAAFTGKFLYTANKLNPNTSLIMSPFSVFVPIGELALYAENDTYTQLINVLNLRNKDDIRCVFPTLTRKLRAEQNIVLNLAARVFATDVHPLTKEFLDDTKNVFDAEAESLNFTDSVAAAARINQWVANQTNDRIKDIVTPGMFGSTTRLVLANAIYFLGNWISKFNSNNTEPRDFNVNSTTTIQVPTMYQRGSFGYAEVESLDCKVLEMFYKGGNFSFVIFLPNKTEGLSLLIEKLQDSDALYAAYNSTSNQKVDVYLPKIKTVSEFNLKEILKAANIIDLFDASLSKLNNILQQYEPLSVSAAKQKAFVQVDETGTEAAAANILGLAGSSRGTQIKDFKADKPFLFYIFYQQTPIFCGTFVNVQ